MPGPLLGPHLCVNQPYMNGPRAGDVSQLVFYVKQGERLHRMLDVKAELK